MILSPSSCSSHQRYSQLAYQISNPASASFDTANSEQLECKYDVPATIHIDKTVFSLAADMVSSPLNEQVLSRVNSLVANQYELTIETLVISSL